MKHTMKSKEMTSRSATFAKGGGKKMAGKSGAAPVEAGKVSVGGRTGDNKFTHRGGGKKMAGQSGAAPVEAGKVSVGGRSGDNSFTHRGGGKKMAGHSGSQNAKPV